MKKFDAEKSVSQLNKELRERQIRKMYLLYGEERYLVLKYFSGIAKMMGASEGDMNTTRFDGKGANITAIIEQAETLPLFADHRVILVTESGLFKSGGGDLAKYLQEPCETTAFLFCESEVDENSKLYKVVKEKGLVVEFTEQREEKLQNEIGLTLKKEGKRISVDTARLILDMIGHDMSLLHCELEKLVCYVGERDTITEEDVRTVCSRTLEDRVYDLMDALGNKQAKKTMDLYYDLLALKIKPSTILSKMEWHFNALLQTKALRESGETTEVMQKKMGVKEFQVKKFLAQSSKYKISELKAIIQKLVETDEAFKKGHISEQLAVETMILGLLS